MRTLISILFMISACAPSLLSDRSPEDAIVEVVSALEKSQTVEFYFVSRTGEYEFDDQGIISNSSVRVARDCGGNCASFMAPILEHLQNSAPANCEPGQQDVLIQWGDNGSLVYSYSGRMIKFEQRCYFNEIPIRDVVKGAGFFFR